MHVMQTVDPRTFVSGMSLSRQVRWCAAGAFLLAAMGLIGPGPVQAQNADEEAGQEVDEVIEVKIATFRYHPDTLQIPSGETVQLVFHNEGNFDHEFMAGREVTQDTSGYQTDLFEDVEVRKSKEGNAEIEAKRQGTTLTIAPDSTQSLTFQLPSSKEGEWKMGCFLTNPALHYEAGMKGTVLVQ